MLRTEVSPAREPVLDGGHAGLRVGQDELTARTLIGDELPEQRRVSR
jgi:hypothetical protein